MEYEYLTRDDWELTLKELKGQRVMHSLQISILNDSIAAAEKRVKSFPLKVEPTIMSKKAYDRMKKKDGLIRQRTP